jgi:hypothetical protein
MRVEGQCHCGAIAYEAEVEPGTVAICNCTDCQMQSGSGFRINIATPADKFHLLRGNPKRYLKVASSGARRIHTFCGNCGGPIYSCAAENTQSYSLRVGALKQRYELWDGLFGRSGLGAGFLGFHRWMALRNSMVNRKRGAQVIRKTQRFLLEEAFCTMQMKETNETRSGRCTASSQERKLAVGRHCTSDFVCESLTIRSCSAFCPRYLSRRGSRICFWLPCDIWERPRLNGRTSGGSSYLMRLTYMR